MDPHTGFIVAAYLATVIVLGGTVVAVVLDHRAQRQALARLGGRLDRTSEALRDDDAR